MSYPQPPQYGPPSGMPQRLPSSGTYVSTAVFGIMAGVLLLMGLTETEHIERMPDELVVILLLQLLVVMGMIAGSILLFTKKFPGVFVFLGATVVYLLTLFLVPALLDVPLGAYVKVLVTETEGIGSYGLFILALSVVSLGCGFAPSTRRYLAFVDARKKQGGPGMVPPSQMMYPPHGQQAPYPQWGQQWGPQSSPQQSQSQPQHPQYGQQPQQWYPGPR